MPGPKFLDEQAAIDVLRKRVKNQEQLVDFAVELIRDHGWRFSVATGGHAHLVGRLYCPCRDCTPFSVNGTSQGLAFQELRKRHRQCPATKRRKY